MMANRVFTDKLKVEKVIHQALGKTKEVVSDMKEAAEEVVVKVEDKM